MKTRRVASPRFLLGMMDGGSFENRILSLLDRRARWSCRRRMAATMACATGIGLVSALIASVSVRPVAAMAQAAGKPATFEVATIKPSDPNAHNSNFGFHSNYHFYTENISLLTSIKFAYDLNMGSNAQIVGAPAWLSNAKFDIDAKPEDALIEKLKATPVETRMALMRPVVQELLAERVKLKVHHETRELRVDVLELAKGGAKLKVSADKRDEKSWEGLHSDRAGHIEGRRATMAMLINMLGYQQEVGGRLVVDKTGLAGFYDFDLQWAPAGSDQTGPSFFTAMEEQMGLRIESTKVPVDVVVIDSVEQPTQN